MRHAVCFFFETPIFVTPYVPALLMKIHPSSLRIALFVLLSLLVTGCMVMVLVYSPVEMVGILGLRNSYLIVFFVSLIGAFTSFTTLTTYPVVVAMAAGHPHPFAIGVVAGLGLSAGDILFYYFGFAARELAGGSLEKRLEKILQRLTRLPQIAIQAFIYFYVAFTPFPNNLLTGILAFTGYPFRKVVVPLVLGDITLPALVAVLVSRSLI